MSKIPDHLQAAHDAGYDAGFHGASVRNCHFGFFASPAHTQAWEDGKAKGDADRVRYNTGRKLKYPVLAKSSDRP